ncbi:acyl-CoA thioesterase [Bacterioplanes sanyensis]|nr:thioesterase family protein [Bacterioplanes sanyensis]
MQPTPQSLPFYLQQASEHDQLTIDPSWGQGRTTFGGMSAALLLQRILHQAGDCGPLRALAVQFCGPLLCNQPSRMDVRDLRSGRSVSHWEAELYQDGDVATRVNACFGQERQSDIDIHSDKIDVGEPGAGQAMAYIKGLTPEFVQHIDFTYLEGGFPFSNSPHNHLKGWMRLKDPTETLTTPVLVALIDAWPPALLQKLKQPAPCASISWNLEIIAPLELQPALSGEQWLYYEVEIRQAHHGYGHTEARIATADGTVLAFSRQLVAVYDQRNK